MLTVAVRKQIQISAAWRALIFVCKSEVDLISSCGNQEYIPFFFFKDIEILGANRPPQANLRKKGS